MPPALPGGTMSPPLPPRRLRVRGWEVPPHRYRFLLPGVGCPLVVVVVGLPLLTPCRWVLAWAILVLAGPLRSRSLVP